MGHWYFKKITGYGRPGRMTKEKRVYTENMRSEDYERESPDEMRDLNVKLEKARRLIRDPIALRRFEQFARTEGWDATKIIVPVRESSGAPVLIEIRGQIMTLAQYEVLYGGR